MTKRRKEQGERINEVCQMVQKLKDLGLVKESYPELDEFHKDCASFIREGCSISGRIIVKGTQRMFLYNLVGSDGIPSTSTLKYHENT